jgi:hypothetical protein
MVSTSTTNIPTALDPVANTLSQVTMIGVTALGLTHGNEQHDQRWFGTTTALDPDRVVHVHKSHHELHKLSVVTAVGKTILLDTLFRGVQELGNGSQIRVGCAYPSRACARKPTWECHSMLSAH